MASTQLLKRRVRSISNTKQITKAMELVAAAKLRRVQGPAAAARIYSDAAIGVLKRLAHSPEAARNPFFSPPASSGKLYIIFSSDRGLAGAYNSNVFNSAARSFAEDAKNRLQPASSPLDARGPATSLEAAILI